MCKQLCPYSFKYIAVYKLLTLKSYILQIYKQDIVLINDKGWFAINPNTLT